MYKRQLHLYAILFAVEIGIMLLVGRLYPRRDDSHHDSNLLAVPMQQWEFAVPCSLSLGSSVIALYVLLSPIGLVEETNVLFWSTNIVLISINLLVWSVYLRKHLWE